MSKFKNSQAGSFLYSIGVAYNDYGTITDQHKNKLFDYFKVDSLTQEQKEKILDACKDAQFKTSSPSYAPEIQHALICFPKAAFYRLNKKEHHA